MTQFGHLLVARQIKKDAYKTDKFRAAVMRISKDENLPCLVVDYDDPDKIIGSHGPPELEERIKQNTVNGFARVGGSKQYIDSIVERALRGEIPAELIDGR